jgi:hypothetical protein
LFGLIGSIATHGSIILAMLFFFLRGGGNTGSTGTNGNGGGEDGQEGAGDTSIDVSLASPASTAPTTQPAPTETAPTPPPTPHPPTPVVPEKAGPDDVSDLPPLPKEIPPPPSKPESANGKNETTNGGKLPGPTRIGMPGGNGGGAGSGNGFGADSIEGQRSLLPKAAVCKDPVAGFWEALKYSPFHGNWVHFKLTVRREGGSVHGTIISRIWSGGPRDSTPPGCFLGGYDVTASMNAMGATNGINISFGSSHATILLTQCPFNGDYYPDNFSGSIDEQRQEFQSRNNDGAVDFDVPYVFRRTGCLDE